jgi:hypothetical protein
LIGVLPYRSIDEEFGEGNKPGVVLLNCVYPRRLAVIANKTNPFLKTLISDIF